MKKMLFYNIGPTFMVNNKYCNDLMFLDILNRYIKVDFAGPVKNCNKEMTVETKYRFCYDSMAIELPFYNGSFDFIKNLIKLAWAKEFFKQTNRLLSRNYDIIYFRDVNPATLITIFLASIYRIRFVVHFAGLPPKRDTFHRKIFYYYSLFVVNLISLTCMTIHTFDHKYILKGRRSISFRFNNVYGKSCDNCIKSKKKGAVQRINASIFGRLSQTKGHLEFIEALHDLPVNIQKKIRVNIYGDGENFNKIRAKIEKLGLSKVVSLDKALSGDDLLKVYCSTDVILIPSLVDGHPKVITESLYLKKPVYLSGVHIDKNLANCYLVDSKDYHDNWKNAIIHICTNPNSIKFIDKSVTVDTAEHLESFLFEQ